MIKCDVEGSKRGGATYMKFFLPVHLFNVLFLILRDVVIFSLNVIVEVVPISNNRIFFIAFN